MEIDRLKHRNNFVDELPDCPEHKQITELVNVLFDRAYTQCQVFRGRGMRNADVHLMVEVNGINNYSIKGASHSTTVNENPLDTELALSRIADLVQAPNNSVVKRLPAERNPFGFTANVIEWLPRSLACGYLIVGHTGANYEQAQADAIKNHSSSPFFHQVGQWAAFSFLLGVQDRHFSNCSWSHASEKFTTFDFEDGLNESPLDGTYPASKLLTEISDLMSIHHQEAQIQEVRAGYEIMHSRMADLQVSICQILRDHAFCSYSIDFGRWSPENVITDWVAGRYDWRDD